MRRTTVTCKTCGVRTEARWGICRKCIEAGHDVALVGGQWVPNERGVMEWRLG